jgi:hypothetical protein
MKNKRKQKIPHLSAIPKLGKCEDVKVLDSLVDMFQQPFWYELERIPKDKYAECRLMAIENAIIRIHGILLVMGVFDTYKRKLKSKRQKAWENKKKRLKIS